MLNQVLRKLSDNRLVFTTSIGFRIIFIVIAGVIILSTAAFGEGPFFERFNTMGLIIILICVLGALYLERWVFDKKSNRFEKNIGVVFLHSKHSYPLNSLEKVVLQERGVNVGKKTKMPNWASRRTVLLSLMDCKGNIYGLDMVKGGTVRELRSTGKQLAEFCDISFEDLTETTIRVQ